MPKRLAGNQLTHDNWDQEEENDEDGGQIGIPTASADEMKGRVIKVARRKGLAGATGSDGPGKSAFTGFSGFGSLKPQTTFSGFGSKSDSAFGAKSDSAFGAKSEPVKIAAEPGKENGTKSAKSDDYYAKLRALNESVSAWIKQHVDKNPYCILTPVFRDYEKHLETVEKLNTEKGATKASTGEDSKSSGAAKFTSVTESKSTENKHVSFSLKSDKTDTDSAPKPAFSFTSTTTATQPASSGFSFGLKKPDENKTESKIVSPKFSFGLKKPEESENSAKKPEPPKFSFGSSSSSTSSSDSAPKFSFGTSSQGGATGGFSFGGLKGDNLGAVKPFSFSSGTSAAKPETSGGGGGEEDEEYVPPKPEVNEVKEEGATYSKRCKLFWMVDGSWKEKGLGNLHLKPLDSGKTQLVMRADTNLGNVILNILLNDSIPVSRSGKNMVNLICIPNPPFDPKSDPKPEKLLLKVKTSDDADELYKKLDEAKK